MGIRTSAAKCLQDVVPHSVAVHCCAHIVDLAIKYVFFKSVEKRLHILYKMYYNSPLCRRGLKQVGQMLQAHVLMLVKLQGTQWIAHRAQHLNTTLTNVKLLAVCYSLLNTYGMEYVSN